MSANPPVVDSSRTHAQETTLQATVPTDFTATSSHWLIEKWNGATWEDHWRFESVQGAPFAGGTVVSFGAPGLVENTDHRARVGFCDGKGTETTADDECFCWSSPTAFTTTGFAAIGPAKPPDPMLQNVEDRFDRPDSDPKCRPSDSTDPLGDGLGPLQVWDDCSTGAGESVTIKNGDAWTTPSAHMYYTRRPATNPNSYAELQFRVDDFGGSGFKYNLQVGTRIVPRNVGGTTQLTGHYLKLLLDARGCTEPTLMLVRLPVEYDAAKCDETPFSHRLTLPTADCDGVAPDPNNRCNCAPPLLEEDSGRPGYSEPVWMRVEAWDVFEDPFPHFTGAIAWGNCPAGEPMSACERYCAFPVPRRDLDDPQQMRNAIGTWGVFFHEKNYAVEVFRAGSEPAP